jgi:hypothetical protein
MDDHIEAAFVTPHARSKGYVPTTRLRQQTWTVFEYLFGNSERRQDLSQI